MGKSHNDVGPHGAILPVDCKVKLMKGITAILPHFLFLAFLPDNVSQHSEKSLVNGFMNKKMGTDDTTTGYEAEMFASVLQPLWWLLRTSVYKID